MINPIVYKRLAAAAKARATIGLDELGRAAGLSTGDADQRKILDLILDQVAEHEAAEGRPLLPVVAIAATGGRAGAGLARYARRKGLPVDDPAFVAAELGRVYAHWADARDPAE
jgi:hypothetical protein